MTTAKQIIIDGVDVSWCEHYTGNIGYLTDKNWTCRAKIQGTKCEDWSNCYFKNWRRKEQECERLNNDNKELQYQLRCTTGREKEWERNCKFWDARCEKLQTELDQLKVENDELKKINNKYSVSNFNVIFMREHIHNLKQILAEIKELLLKTPTDSPTHCINAKSVILQKISEVEDA